MEHLTSVYKQKTTSGETRLYYYDLMIDGKRFKGRCIGCIKKREAEQSILHSATGKGLWR